MEIERESVKCLKFMHTHIKIGIKSTKSKSKRYE
jgi:hypothetical protein